jgi:hypothetical protein
MKCSFFGPAAAFLLVVPLAHAQPAESKASQGTAATSGSTQPLTSAAPPAPSGPPSATQVADAKERFRRALELHDEGNLDAARTELRRAYEIAPNYKVLFNLGQVEFELLDYPAALATFEKYLSEGGDRVPKDRRAQVESDIEKLRGRVGSIEIAVSVPGSLVAVDDVTVGTTPLLRPIFVSAGRRRITVSHSGYTSESRLVDVAGADHGTMNFELVDASRTAAPPVVVPVAAETAAPAPAPLETPPPAPETTNRRSVPWVGWVATALFATGAGITGGLALQRSQLLASERARYGAESSELERIEKEATNFAVASDIFAGAAVFSGVISLYLTLSPSGEHKEQGRSFHVTPAFGSPSKEQARSIRVTPALRSVSVEGSF